MFQRNKLNKLFVGVCVYIYARRFEHILGREDKLEREQQHYCELT